MANSWPLQDAKARFSELFSRVLKDGPQRVTRHGKEAVILITEAEYENLSGKSRSFTDYLLSGPKAELDIRRSDDFGRRIEL
jgi:prevent-host-death family protein